MVNVVKECPHDKKKLGFMRSDIFAVIYFFSYCPVVLSLDFKLAAFNFLPLSLANLCGNFLYKCEKFIVKAAIKYLDNRTSKQQKSMLKAVIKYFIGQP